ncbi:dihydroorotase [bacterium]|nr:dihydroorotase [candidate division CSSED10-310 bacterium]
MQDIILKNGRIIDPTQDLDDQTDLLIRDGRIEHIGILNDGIPEGATVIDIDGKWCVPGLVDMHVHLREPGREDKETIQTGTMAAVAGGFTAVACMPNTNPVNDSAAVTRFIMEKARSAPAVVYPIAAVTRGLEGIQLTEMVELHEAGAVAFSDDGHCIMNADNLRRALDYVKIFGGLIIDHCEDPVISKGGVMREGFICTTLGFPPIPSLAEELMVARDIRIAEYTGSAIHIAHVSSRESVRLIRDAKNRGIRVSAEVTPHHLFLTDEAVKTFDTNTKMNPPLGTEEDREILEEAVISGVIDCIATDHAPHTDTEKQVEYSLAPNGIIGLETALPLVMTRLVHTRKMNPSQMIRSMSTNPSRLLGIEGGSLLKGAPAHITVIDPDRLWMVDPMRFYSKSQNTPFGGLSLRGSCNLTLVHGKIAFQSSN